MNLARTKSLLLFRHAEADYSEPLTSDHNMPLSSKGRRDARKIAGEFKENILIPDYFISSSARRAYDTSIIFKDKLKRTLLENIHLWRKP